MYRTVDNITKQNSKHTVCITATTSRRNPVAAASAQHANAAGFHEPVKYSRKTKHKPALA